MKSLRLLIVIFCMALSVPLVLLVFQAYRSLDSEEMATLDFFAETLFDEMQETLAAVIRREEARPVNAYENPVAAAAGASPLSAPAAEDFIHGYFQNNPDGSMQTPLTGAGRRDRSARFAEMEDANRIFNRKRADATDKIRPESAGDAPEAKQKAQANFASRYLDMSRSQREKSYLGEKDSRLEIAPGRPPDRIGTPEPLSSSDMRSAPASASAPEGVRAEAEARPAPRPAAGAATPSGPRVDSKSLQAEVAPFQSVFIDDGRVFVFRRVLIDSRIYRQGFVIDVEGLLRYLADAHFAHQPMAGYTRLRLRAVDHGREARVVEAGAAAGQPAFAVNRVFPVPFAFLRVGLTCENIPRSPARRTVNLTLTALAGVVLIGLLAIYGSTKKIVDYSERQSRFVSAVTHELKTPLTNIRMYIEMLEQGIAPDPEREQAYYRILQSEGARLSRLIENVLELSKLEKNRREPNLLPGRFDDVLAEVETLMQASLKQEGFVLTVDNRLTRPFRYDREVMVQVLINLIENSIKFGKGSGTKAITVRLRERGGRVVIEVSDTGPGIPRQDLDKVFNDFYRADDAVARAAGGTGIGLALVKRFVALSGGRVSASNNDGTGCTITIEFFAG
jgi:signal transduction histidine kinase